MTHFHVRCTEVIVFSLLLLASPLCEAVTVQYLSSAEVIAPFRGGTHSLISPKVFWGLKSTFVLSPDTSFFGIDPARRRERGSVSNHPLSHSREQVTPRSTLYFSLKTQPPSLSFKPSSELSSQLWAKRTGGGGDNGGGRGGPWGNKRGDSGGRDGDGWNKGGRGGGRNQNSSFDGGYQKGGRQTQYSGERGGGSYGGVERGSVRHNRPSGSSGGDRRDQWQQRPPQRRDNSGGRYKPDEDEFDERDEVMSDLEKKAAKFRNRMSEMEWDDDEVIDPSPLPKLMKKARSKALEAGALRQSSGRSREKMDLEATSGDDDDDDLDYDDDEDEEADDDDFDEDEEYDDEDDELNMLEQQLKKGDGLRGPKGSKGLTEKLSSAVKAMRESKRPKRSSMIPSQADEYGDDDEEEEGDDQDMLDESGSVMNHQTDIPVDMGKLQHATQLIKEILGVEKFKVSVELVDEAHMRVVNHDMRGENKTTDILSFPSYDITTPGELPEVAFVDAEEDPEGALLGDLVISPKYVDEVLAEDRATNEARILTRVLGLKDESVEAEPQGETATIGVLGKEGSANYYEGGVGGALSTTFNRDDRLELLLIHGMIHLLGHDHESEGDRRAMIDKEDRVIKEYNKVKRTQMRHRLDGHYIVGVGTDLCFSPRIRESLKVFGEAKYTQRILSARELEVVERLRNWFESRVDYRSTRRNRVGRVFDDDVSDWHQFLASHLAKRYASKEAVSKSLGTGLRHMAEGGIRLRDIEIWSRPSGEPAVELLGKAKEVANGRGVVGVYLSQADEGDYAVSHATAVGSTNTRYDALLSDDFNEDTVSSIKDKEAKLMRMGVDLDEDVETGEAIEISSVDKGSITAVQSNEEIDDFGRSEFGGGGLL